MNEPVDEGWIADARRSNPRPRALHGARIDVAPRRSCARSSDRGPRAPQGHAVTRIGASHVPDAGATGH
jgi:hypothetical protein